jgi:hypothetical protein
MIMTEANIHYYATALMNFVYAYIDSLPQRKGMYNYSRYMHIKIFTQQQSL